MLRCSPFHFFQGSKEKLLQRPISIIIWMPCRKFKFQPGIFLSFYDCIWWSKHQYAQAIYCILPLSLKSVLWASCENQRRFAEDKLIWYSSSSDPRYLEIVPAVWQGLFIQSLSSLIYEMCLLLLINPEGSSDFVSLRRKRWNYLIHCNCFVYSIVAWSRVHWSQRESFELLQWAQVHNALLCRTSEVSLEGLKTTVAFSTLEVYFKSTQTCLHLHSRKGVKLNV